MPHRNVLPETQTKKSLCCCFILNFSLTLLTGLQRLGAVIDFIFDFILSCWSDDGINPERVAQVMGQPDHCQHAVHLINELVQTAQVCASGFNICSFN